MKKERKQVKILYILPTLDCAGGIESYVMNYYLNFSNKFTEDFIAHEKNFMYYKDAI